jgi:hypothetical protein
MPFAGLKRSTGNIAFTFVKNPHLMEAVSAIGVPTI